MLSRLDLKQYTGNVKLIKRQTHSKGVSMNNLIPVVLCGACLAIFPALAQADGTDEWQFQIAPLYLWAMNLDGTMQLGSGPSGDFEVDFSDAFDNLQTAFTVHFEASKGRWGLLADVSYLNLKGDQPIPTPGDTAEVKVKNLILEGAGGYRVADRLWVIAGLRYFKLDPTVSFQVLPDLDPSTSWTDAFAGIMWRPRLGERWTLGTRFDIGAGGSDLVWNAMAVIDYRLGTWAAVFAGYRHMDYDYSSSTTVLRYDVSMSGPVAAFRFFW
jgi:hypothetical protein